MIQQFIHPGDIPEFGHKINLFSYASKELAKFFDLVNGADSADRMLGKGPYNSLRDKSKGYIHYGEYLTGRASGLFGAFATIHFPELAMAKHMPAWLGKAGCRLVAQSEGRQASWPLDQAEFYFTPRTDTQKGRLILANDLQADGLSLACGTPLTQTRPIINTYTSEYDQKWRNDKIRFSIVDAQGRDVEPAAAIKMIWGHIEATHGLKRFGRASSEFDTLAQDGNDDDVQAERAMVYTLESVRDRNGIDLMPRFNALVQKAAAALNRRPDMLQAIASSIYICDAAVEEGKRHGLLSEHLFPDNQVDEQNRAIRNFLKYAPLEALKYCSAMLDLDLSKYPPTEQDRKFAREIGKTFEQESYRLAEQRRQATIRQFRNVILRVIEPNPNPFSPDWLTGFGNRPRRRGTSSGQIDPLVNRALNAGWDDVMQLLGEKLQTQGVAMAQKELRLIHSSFVRAASIVNRPSGDIHQRLRAAGDAAETIQIGLSQTPPTQDVSREVEHIRAAFEMTKQSFSDQRLLFTKGQSARILAFLGMMDAVDHDPGRLVEMYGDCSRLRRHFEARVSIPTQKAGIAALKADNGRSVPASPQAIPM